MWERSEFYIINIYVKLTTLPHGNKLRMVKAKKLACGTYIVAKVSLANLCDYIRTPFFVPSLGKFTLAQGQIYHDKFIAENSKK